MKHKKHFTMVEILLALGVCVIGVVSIMVFFPVGLSASRDSAMETYAANAADQMLNYLKYTICYSNDNWDDYILGDKNPPPKIPEFKKDDDSPFSEEDEEGSSYNVTIPTKPPTWSSSDFSGIADNVLEHQGDNGVYLLLSSRETNPDIDSDKIDFRAIVNVRHQQVEVLPLEMAVQLLVEVSWPAELPYKRRQKSLFALEVFNPNYTP